MFPPLLGMPRFSIPLSEGSPMMLPEIRRIADRASKARFNVRHDPREGGV